MLGKIFLVAAVASLATVAAVDKCSTSQALAVNKISPDAAKACTAETAFKAVKPTGYPDDAQLTLMCASDNCKTFIAALLQEWNPSPPCEFDFGSGSPVVNVRTVADDFAPNCARLAGGGQTTTAPPAPTTTAPPTPTTTVPEPTTLAPEPTTTAPPATTAPPPSTPSVAPHC